MKNINQKIFKNISLIALLSLFVFTVESRDTTGEYHATFGDLEFFEPTPRQETTCGSMFKGRDCSMVDPTSFAFKVCCIDTGKHHTDISDEEAIKFHQKIYRNKYAQGPKATVGDVPGPNTGEVENIEGDTVDPKATGPEVTNKEITCVLASPDSDICDTWDGRRFKCIENCSTPNTGDSTGQVNTRNHSRPSDYDDFLYRQITGPGRVSPSQGTGGL